MDKKKAITLVVFSGDLDKIMASFIIATGAAASGMKVNMFFTFWGLKLLQREGAKSKGLGWMKTMFSFMVKPGPEKRPISKLNMMGMGASMMKKIMKKSNMPDLKSMLFMAYDLGVKMTACTTSMGVLGIKKDTLIPEVTNVAGVASFLADANESSSTLFI
jgi:peroxiredoxin family protein